MDIFKKMGITVGGNQALVQEHTQKSDVNNEISHNNIIRKGNGMSPRDVLEQQLSKGGITIRPMSDDEMSSPDEKAKAKAINPYLKNSHGEEFHSDNDKQVEKLQTEGEVIQSEFEDEKPVKIEFSKSEAVLHALGDITKADIKMPKKEFVAEHKKLVNVLESPSKKDDKKEAKDQKEELDSIKACKKSMVEAFDALDDIIKGGKILSTRIPKHAPKPEKSKEEKKIERQQLKEQMGKSVPEGVSKKEFNKIANLHENSKGVGERPKKPVFLKSSGPGGMIFDFGGRTGNAIADNATAMLNQFADPIQENNARYAQDSYKKALDKYVTKGETAYMQEVSPFGNIDASEALSKPMDVQVKESFEKGEFSNDNSKPAVINHFNKTEMMLGGEVIKATSETDAALIEMMKNSMVQDDGQGMIADIGGSQGRIADIS